MSRKIQEIEKIKSLLEYHYQKYWNNKYDLQCASRKNDKKKASDKMLTHVKSIEQLLRNSHIINIIDNGGQFQFEGFRNFIESDFPDYLKSII
jgi:hypothetical protein